MLDRTAIAAAFAQPDSDGAFTGPFLDYLQEIGRARPIVLFAFPPKAAGTFLRTAAIRAAGGQLVRIVHAQGGRDAQPYLPLLLDYLTGGLTPKVLVSHVHMQALPANRNLLDALGIRPVAMLRSIPDMLASFWDMLERDPDARRDGLNCPVPEDFARMHPEQKADFCLDILAPWYVGYYASWFAYTVEAPERVLMLRYADFAAAPDATLERALRHAGLAPEAELCRAALAQAWDERAGLRFNAGVSGRGSAYFSSARLLKLERMLAYHPILAARVPELIGER